MSQPERKVLAQDQPQYQQSQRINERKRQAAAEKQYQLDLKQYDAEVAAQKKAEADYQTALAKADNAERKALEKQYKDQIDAIDAATKAEAANIPQYETVYDRNTRSFVEKPIDKSVQKSMRDAILRKADEQKKNIQYTATTALNQFDFSQKYPNAIIGGSVRDQFKGSLGQESLISIYEKHVTDKATDAEYKRRTSIQTAQNAPRYTDLQRSAIESEHVSILFTPSPQTQAAIDRANQIKPTLPPTGTIFPTVPTMAENTRRPLINVETGNYIGNKWQPNNPVALVAGLTKPQIKEGVQIAKTPEKESVQDQTQIITNTTPQVNIDLVSPYIKQGSQGNPVRGRQPDLSLVSPFINQPKQESFKVVFVKSEDVKTPFVSKIQGPQKEESNLLEGLARPVANLISAGKDFGIALLNNDFVAPKSFTDSSNPFGLPVPRQTTPSKPTASSELLSGRMPNLSDPGILGSAITEVGLLVGGLKTGGLSTKLKGVKNQPEIKPTIKPNEKIYPKNQEPLTPELVNKPIIKNTSFTVENINIGKGTTNISQIPKPVKTVQADPFYKPATRANEIDVPFGDLTGFKSTKIKLGSAIPEPVNVKGTFRSTRPVEFDTSYKPATRANEIDVPFGELVDFKKTNVNLGRATAPTPPIRGKIAEPVKPDPFYKPTSRTNEINMNDFTLVDFKYSTVKLGKGTVRQSDIPLKGKQTNPVESDPFYKPSKRSNEIDFTDKADSPKITFKENLKSETPLDLNRELKRLKKKQPEFKTDNVKLGGTSIEIKSGSQNLVQIQKAETTTKQKLKTQRQSPVNINWTEKIETSKLPETGKSPTTRLIIPQIKKEQKRKPYLVSTSSVLVYEQLLSPQRPKLATKTNTIIKTVQAPKQDTSLKSDVSFKFSTPQKLSYSVTPKLATKQRQRTDTFQVLKPIQVIRPKQAEKQVQRQATPTPLKIPTRTLQPSKLKQPIRQVFKYDRPTPREPPRTRPIGLLPPKDTKIPKSVKDKNRAKQNFLGNASEISISGLFGKRKEITYGDKKITKLLKGDLRVVKGQKRTTYKRKEKKDLFGFKKNKTKFF